MEGYFVVTKQPDENNKSELELLTALRKTGLIDLHTTRSFNGVTKGVYKSAAKSAITRIRNKDPQAQAKRKAYYALPTTKQRLLEQSRTPEAKERKRRVEN